MFTLLNRNHQFPNVVGLPQTCGKDRHASQGTGNAPLAGYAMKDSARTLLATNQGYAESLSGSTFAPRLNSSK